MARLRVSGVFFLGMLAGLGAAAIGVAHIRGAAEALDLRPLSFFFGGLWLLVGGLTGGALMIRGRWPQGLRTLMVGVALLAVTVSLQRRSDRLAGLQTPYRKLCRLGADLDDFPPFWRDPLSGP